MYFNMTFVKGDINPRWDRNKKRIVYGDDQRESWYDWELIPSARPVPPPPDVKTQMLGLDSVSGDGIDLSEALTGFPIYKNRSFSQEFYRQKDDNWSTAIPDILNWGHGRQVSIIFDDTPNYYFTGRLSIKETTSDKYYSKITISCSLSPFKTGLVRISDTFENEALFDLIDMTKTYKSPSVSRTITAERKMTEATNTWDIFIPNFKDLTTPISCRMRFYKSNFNLKISGAGYDRFISDNKGVAKAPVAIDNLKLLIQRYYMNDAPISVATGAFKLGDYYYSGEGGSEAIVGVSPSVPIQIGTQRISSVDIRRLADKVKIEKFSKVNSDHWVLNDDHWTFTWTCDFSAEISYIPKEL